MFTLLENCKKVYLNFLTTHLGSIYFINHKKKNKCNNQYKCHDSQLFLDNTHYNLEYYHYNREDYCRKHPAVIRRPQTSPEGSLKLLTSGAYREISGEQYKNGLFFEKNVFSEVIVLVLHVCFCFLQEEQIFKSSKWRGLRDPNVGRPFDQIMGRSNDNRGTSVKHVFEIQITNTLNSFGQVTQDFIANGSEIFSEQYGWFLKKIKQEQGMMSSGRYY